MMCISLSKTLNPCLATLRLPLAVRLAPAPGIRGYSGSRRRVYGVADERKAHYEVHRSPPRASLSAGHFGLRGPCDRVHFDGKRDRWDDPTSNHSHPGNGGTVGDPESGLATPPRFRLYQ